MFKLEYAGEFDKYFPKPTHIVQRVKEKGSSPRFASELVRVNTSNLEGVPVHFDGFTAATPRFKITMYCDVCDMPVMSTTTAGKSKPVEAGDAAEIEATFSNDKPEIPRQYLRFYSKQCAACGRWAGRGSNHIYCFDAARNTCTKCIE